MRRRAVLQGIAATGAAAAGAPARGSSTAAVPAWAATLAARATALGAAGLLLSYETAPGGGIFDRLNADCAYTYDNAVAGLALLDAGHVPGAVAIAAALAQAQATDRFWTDGRLRNAYRAGPTPATGPYPLPGFWDGAAGKWVEDAYHAGTATGVVAWAMMLWCAVARRTGQTRFRDAAARAADWVTRATRVTDGFAGGFLGFEPGPQRLAWLSTEHNLDLSVAFAALGRGADAAAARGFVARMWLPSEARFLCGLKPDGAPNPTRALDADLWPLLAPAPDAAWAPALAAALRRHGVVDGALHGLDFNDDRDGVWLEGTAYGALAAKRRGMVAEAAAFMATLEAQTAPSGLIYAASVPRLTTGLSTGLMEVADFFYYRRPALAPTAWAALAASGTSPFDLSQA